MRPGASNVNPPAEKSRVGAGFKPARLAARPAPRRGRFQTGPPLRVIILADGETAPNAFPDRDFGKDAQ